jgi:hypothetical protein
LRSKGGLQGTYQRFLVERLAQKAHGSSIHGAPSEPLFWERGNEDDGDAVNAGIPALHGFPDESSNRARATVAKAKLMELERQAAAAIEAHERQMRETEEFASTKRRLGALQRLWRRGRPDSS